MWVLIRTDQNPPGSFPYEQTEGLYKKFDAQSEIETQAHIVSDFRKGNGLARATVGEAYLDIVLYTCQRLGNNPRFCYDTEASNRAYSMPAKLSPRGGCGGCGARVQ